MKGSVSLSNRRHSTTGLFLRLDRVKVGLYCLLLPITVLSSIRFSSRRKIRTETESEQAMRTVLVLRVVLSKTKAGKNLLPVVILSFPSYGSPTLAYRVYFSSCICIIGVRTCVCFLFVTLFSSFTTPL